MPPWAPPTPAGDRRVQHQQTLRFGHRRNLARGLNIDGRAVDQQCARARAFDDAVGTEIGLAHFGARRKHGDDHFGIVGRRSGLAGGGATGSDQLADRVQTDVVTSNLVTGLDQVLRHRAAHIPEADKAYSRHLA